MERRQQLMTRLHKLEKRLDDLEVGFGELVEISLTLEAVLELLVDRRVIPHRQPSRLFRQALESYRGRIGQYTEEQFQQLRDSLLDDEMESLDEGEMPYA
jgi:thioesterase domain-containing protein